MERPYSHSKPPTFSSKKKPPYTTTNGGFFSATSYDDVFGGPPKFASSSSLAPRPEDYSEIFGGFRLSSSSSSSSMNSRSSSSIPVLDLPSVPDDIGAAFFDYSEVFCAFNAVDFAVSFDQLFNPCDGSFIEEEDDDDDYVDAAHGGHGDGDGGGGVSSDEAWTPVGTESLSDDSDQFTSSETRQSFSSRKPHQQSESKQFNVSYHKVNPGTSATAPNTMHVAQLNDMPGYTCVVDGAILMRENGKEKNAPILDSAHDFTKKTKSQMNPTFSSVYDVNLRTEPSNLPPPSKSPPIVMDKSKELSEPSFGLNLASEKRGFEETGDCGLPPFFDTELDGSSFAATSTSALEDAMEKAQAKMKTAKESRERKDRSQNSGKVHLQFDANDGENKSDRGPSKIKNNAKARHAKSTSQNLLNILAVDQPTSVSEKPDGTKQGKRNSLSSDNALTDDVGQWKEAMQYYEFVNNENTRSTPQINSSNGDAKTITHQGDDYDDDFDLGGEACLAGENRRRLKATKVVSRQEYYEKMVKVALEVHDGVKSGPDKKQKHMPTGNPRQRKPELVCEPEMLEIPLSRTREMKEEKAGNTLNNEFENEEEGIQACDNDQVDKKVKGLDNVVEEASFVEQGSLKKDEGCYSVQDNVEREGNEQKAQESHGVRIESRVREVSKQKKNKESGSERKDDTYDLQRMKEADKRLKEAFETWKQNESQEDNMMRRMQTKDGYENHVDEVVNSRASKKTLEKRDEQSKNDTKLPEQAIGRQMLYEARDLRVDSNNLEKFEKQDVEKAKPEKAIEIEQHVEHESLEACEMDKLWGNLEEGVDVHGHKTTLKRSVELEKSAINTDFLEPVVKMERLVDTHDSIVDNKNSEEFQGQDKTKKQVEKTAEPEHESLNECELRETTKINENTDHINFEWVEEDKVRMELPVDDSYMESSNGTELEGNEQDILCNFKNLQKKADDFKEVTAKKDYDEMGTRASDGKNKLDVIDEKKIESNVVEKVSEECELEDRTEQTREKEGKEVPPSTSDPNVANDIDSQGGRTKNLAEGQVLFDQSDRVRSTFERKEKIINHNSSSEYNKEKDRDLEKERLQKLEEERERLREREKDRMAVEMTIREARDRAYADARDRAERGALERATDEARQRAMAEARERLEKACAEARERSLADKEARLRAERAAVERATNEARQRAIEKAMAERTTFEARDRMQRSVSEKYFSEREVIMRQSSFPASNERSDSEPAQRCKARLERHRRTVERVAKALAEKNMRDLVAQREQAERTRLAETLDADIRRWSSGKEGNLRALLSTLQYILGPDSGWQPIPLTEVITAAAVKKAYRKATLCVHPDKLQQRGATIQQKYTCEKVFDLLKEAWTRFNSEEK